MGSFMELRVWQTARDLAVRIYKLTQNQYFVKDFGFKDQIQRAAVSIASNIAEGDESGSDRHSIRYFNIARGLVAELMTHLIIAFEIGYVDKSTKEQLIDECDKISSMLTKLIFSRTK